MNSIEQVLVFKIGDNQYCIDSSEIDQILRVPAITPLPNSQQIVKGLCTVNGHVVSVFDVSSMITDFDISVDLDDSKSRMITIKYDELIYAILVEDVINNIIIDENTLVDNQNSNSDLTDGVINSDNTLIQILSIKKLISFIKSHSMQARKFNLASKSLDIAVDVDENIHNKQPYLVFKMADEEFAINIGLIREIILRSEKVIKIADSLPEIMGLITLRDNILVSVDFRTFFGVKGDNSNKNRLIILDYNSKNIAILVDEIIDIVHVDVLQLDPMPNEYQDNRISGVVTKEDESITSILSDSAITTLIQKIQSFDEKQSIKVNDKTDADMSRLIPFILGKEEYAFDVDDIEEIIRYSNVTSIPDTQDFILGLINLRGSMIPIISLYSKMSLKNKEINDDTKVLIVSINGFKLGFIVDKITGIIDVSGHSITDNSKDSEMFPEIIILEDGNRIILKMNIKGILGEKEMQKLQAY